MSEPGSRRGRAHDAEGAREAILDAAEATFAEHGFDGARVDVIAAKAGYNKSLIFQYFNDKLNLYSQVLKRADEEMNALQALLFTPLAADETLFLDAQRLKALLETIVQTLFDYMVEHPRLKSMLVWEMAEGWQTYSKISEQLQPNDAEPIDIIFRKAQAAGLLRSTFAPMIQLTLILQVCISYLAFLPLFQMIMPNEKDLSSPTALAEAKKYIVQFVVSGMLVDSVDPNK